MSRAKILKTTTDKIFVYIIIKKKDNGTFICTAMNGGWQDKLISFLHYIINMQCSIMII